MTVLFWLFAAYGFAFFLQNKLPRPEKVPELVEKLLGCIYCLGFHSGWILWAARTTTFADPRTVIVDLLSWGFASAAFAYLVDTLARWLESAPTFGE